MHYIEVMGPYIVQIPAWFPTRKAAQVTAFFAIKAGGSINILRATKLIYLADRLCMEQRDHLITGDDLVSMPFGPVNTHTLRYMNGEASNRNDEWQEFIGPRSGYDIPLSRDINLGQLDELSRAELRVLEETWSRFEDVDKYDLAEWTHKFCPEWQFPHGSSIPINFSTVFRKLEKEDPSELAENIQSERALFLDLICQD